MTRATWIGAAALVALLEAVGRLGLAGSTWPPFSRVLAYLATPKHLGLVARGLTHTLETAGLALILGSLLAVALALLTHRFAWAREGVLGFGVFINAFPPVSVAPVLVILTTDRMAGILLAAAFVFFLVHVSMVAGLARAKGRVGDMFQAFGAGRADRFLRLDLPASLPALASGLAQAIPAALVGAILAEWFSGDRGIGLLLISAMRNYQTELLWAAMLATSVTSLALYGLAQSARAALQRRFALED